MFIFYRCNLNTKDDEKRIKKRVLTALFSTGFESFGQNKKIKIISQ